MTTTTTWHSIYFNSTHEAEQLSAYLRKNRIYFEVSQCGNGLYFSILATDEQATQVNAFLS